MGDPLLPQAVNKVHDRKLRHVAIFRPEWWKEGDFFFHEERGRVISLCDMMWVLDNFSPTLMDCLICLYLCIYLSLFSYSSGKYHSTLTDSEYRQLMHFSWIAVCILTLLPRPLPLPPSLATPLATFYGSQIYFDDVLWFARTFFGLFAILSFYWDTSFIGQSTNLSYDCSSNEAYLSTCFNFK